MGMPKKLHNAFLSEVYKHAKDAPAFVELPFGQIIGSVNLVETFPTESVFSGAGGIGFKTNSRIADGDQFRMMCISLEEKAFGDYSLGRFGWLLSNPVQFKTGIPINGKLGIWQYDGPLPE